MQSFRLRALALSAVAITATASIASATSLRLSPIGLEMPATQRAAAMSLMNTDDKPVSVQVRIFRWTQEGAEEKLEPATDMLVSPPAATIPPGKTYTLRVARLSTGLVGGERSYRLLIDEIPNLVDQASGQGVAMVLRTSVPVFVVDKDVASKLDWQMSQDGDGLHIRVTNQGNRHAKIAGLAARGKDGATLSFGAGLNGYVLPGSTRRFDLHASAGHTLPDWRGADVMLTAKDGFAEIGAHAIVTGS